MRVEVIVAAGGKGERFGKSRPKQFCLLQRRPILCWTVKRFEECRLVDNIILIIPPGMKEYTKEIVLSSSKYKKIKTVVEGGKERGDSVFRGLEEVGEDTNIVLIHDGVRPLVSSSLIERVIEETKQYEAVSLGVPIKQTVKKIGQDNLVIGTPNREKLYFIQTPQGFKKDLIQRAHREAKKLGWKASDDASLVERLGHKIKIIPGEETNIKITTPLDLKFAEILLREKEFAELSSYRL